MPANAANAYKLPVSVLVVIHTADLQVLLLERARHPGYWQSVTGSLEIDETPQAAARRELLEETGLDAQQFALTDWQQTHRFEIFAEWRHRYAPTVTENTEHVFSLQLPRPLPIQLAAAEHSHYRWLDYRQAAAQCFSWSNRDSILALATRLPAAAALASGRQQPSQ